MITENKTERITVRLPKEDLLYLKVVSYVAGMKPSEYLRTLANASITALKIKEKNGEINLDNFKALFNDKL